MTKPFMKKELSEKVILQLINDMCKHIFQLSFLFQLFYHSVDSDTIFDHIPKEIMPTEIGGSGKSSKLVDGKQIIYKLKIKKQVLINTNYIKQYLKLN